jgi:hypothetical protein
MTLFGLAFTTFDDPLSTLCICATATIAITALVLVANVWTSWRKRQHAHGG